MISRAESNSFTGAELDGLLPGHGAALVRSVRKFAAEPAPPPLQIHCKWKKNQYFRILMSAPSRGIFAESYLDHSEWERYDRTRSDLAAEADRELSAGRRDAWNARCDDLARLCRNLTAAMELPDPDGFAALDVLCEAGENPPDFEMLHPAVTRRLRMTRTPSTAAQGGRSVLLFDPAVAGAQEEVGKLRETGKGFSEWECLSTALYEGQKGRLRGTETLHFTGHGKRLPEGGAWMAGNRPVYEAPACSSPVRVFLNCCLAGADSSGIVASFLREGAREVIASPWNLPDDGSAALYGIAWQAIRAVYPERPDAAARAVAEVFPAFPRLYRRFGVYGVNGDGLAGKYLTDVPDV
jgi:hypothetical protein